MKFHQLLTYQGIDVFGHTDGTRQWVISRSPNAEEYRVTYKSHPNGKTHWLNDMRPFSSFTAAVKACETHKKSITQ